jgi:6-phosphofructokinase 2
VPAILTLTFNPCIDVNVSVDELKPEIKLRCNQPLIQPGGGGINVARAIRKLGGRAMALFPAGGANGQHLKTLLIDENIGFIPIRIQGETRQNIIVKDHASGLQYRFNMPGPELTSQDCQRLLSIVKDQPRLDYLVVSGSLAPGVTPEIFDELVTIACHKSARLIVDTSGPALKRAAFCGAHLLKISIHELSFLMGGKVLSTKAEIEEAASFIVSRGTSTVVISLGADGALWTSDSHHGYVTAPPVKTVSTVGAGDSMVAGIVWSLATGRQFPDAIRYGIACGTSATKHPGTSLCERKDVEHLLEQMKEMYNIPHTME